MKKLLLLLVGAIVAIGAHAQLYLCGADKSFGSWDPANPIEVAEKDGYYSFTAIKNSEFQMSTAKGDWDAFNGSRLYLASDWTTENGIKSASLTTTNPGGDAHKFVLKDDYLYVRVKSDCSLIELCENEDFSGEGGGQQTSIYKLKGTFTGVNWALVALPYTYTFDGTQGEQQYGIEDENGKFYSGATTFSGETVTWTISGNSGNDKIKANYRGTVKFSVSGNVFTVEEVGEVVPTTAYELWTNFRNGDTFLGYVLNEENNYSYTLNFQGDETDTKVGLHVDGSWIGAGNTSAYDGNAKTYNMTTTEGGDITFAAGLQGAVTFVLNIADNTLSVSGGSIEQGGDDDEYNDYTIYFYDQNNIAGEGLYVHIWNGDGASAHTFRGWGNSSDIKMSNTGKYIRRIENGVEKYYPIYVLHFSWNEVPEKILVWNGVVSNEKKFTDDAVFLNNGYYTNGSSSAEVNLSPVEIGDVYLYFHFKEDLIYEAVNGTDSPTYCNVMNGDSYIGGLVRDDAHKMELVSDKYQIYRYKLTAEELAQGNNVEFSFENKAEIGGGWATFRADYAEKFNKARWTDFIYASAKRDVPGVGSNVQYAVQTYMGWAEFAALDALGRPAAYLVGEGAIEGLSWTPADPMKYVNTDGSCFYIPVDIQGTRTTFFKVSWVDVKTYKEHATEGMTCDARDWATFDLGIVGVDDKFSYPDGSYEPNIESIEGQDVNCTVFDTNTSVKYCNYNQYNWTIDGVHLEPGRYYVVIDTHDTCRTVTLVNFDPNPSVVVKDASINAETLTPEQAIALHRHYNHLSLASHNGHIAMDKVNTCEGTLVINGSSGLDISNSGFDIEYSVAMNGDQVVSYHGKPGSIHLNYMPFGTANDIEVRAMYTDIDHIDRKGTGLTFHSRRGSASVEVPAEMPAPYAKINNAQYVKYLNEEPYGVLLDDIEFECVTDYNVYGDLSFTFDVPDADTSRRVEIIHSGHELTSKMNVSTLAGWTPLVLSEDSDFAHYDFEGGSNDWSSLIIKEGVNVPVLLNKYTDIFSKELLEDKTVEGVAHAIYPFLYETNPSIQVEPENGSSAPRKAASVASLPSDLAGFAISHFDRSYPISIEVAASNAISGIENVAFDAAADAEAEYFTISGIRVEGTPEPGIYLRRVGDKVSKVVVR